MTRSCGDWLDSYLKYTTDTLPPPIFHMWTGICVLSTALQRKVYARSALGAEYYPNFFTFLVGEPGTGKSTAIKIGQRLAVKAGLEFEVDSSTTAFLQGAFKEAYLATAALLGEEHAHASVVVFADELETFLKNERYDSELFKLLTKAYNCPDVLRHGTITGGRIEAQKAFMTILGGIQPDNLNKQIPPETIGSGFASRVTFIYHPPQHVDLYWDDSPEVGKPEEEEALIRDLAHIATLQGQCSVTPGFKELWHTVGTESANQLKCPLGDGLITYWRRRVQHLTKMSIVFCASRGDKLRLEEQDLKRAMKVLAEAEEHMPAVVSSLTKGEERFIMQDIHKALLDGGPKTLEWLYSVYDGDISAYELQNRVLRDLKLQGKVDVTHKNGVTYYRAKGGKV